METDGNTRWRGTTGVTWRKGAWTGGLSGYYIGRFADSATTTAATYTNLGEPRYIAKQFDSGRFLYRYVVGEVITYNAFAGYRFGRDANALVRNTNVRLGVVNLLDRDPPLTSGALGYSPSVHGTMFPGRTWTLELSRRF
jgi:outer membrane receptor protein involved in Fe transport